MKTNTNQEDKESFLNKNKEKFREMFESLKKLAELEKKIIVSKAKENVGKSVNS